jgi:hypothetical protein
MGTLASSIRTRWGRWTVAAGVALAVLVPAVAFAATASFSSKSPSSGSTITNTRPTIAVTVYDRYGAHGSSAIKMSVDGHSVRPSVTYIVSGGFNPAHPDYRRFKVTYRPGTAFSTGSHKVTVTIHDKKHKTSTSSWSFKVAGPEPAYGASFSSASPARDSSSTVTRPSISVSVSDKYGVKGSGTYSMSIDGTSVVASVKYAKSGDYDHFTVSYRPSSGLPYGTHVVSVGVTDLHKHHTDYSWGFTVNGPDPVYEEMPVAGAACTDCHTGYPAAHPMQQCSLCHGADRPVGPPSYSPSDISAHTLACSLESPCHGGGGGFPHVLSSDCESCHGGQYADIPASHSLDVVALHTAPTTFCTAKGCHATSLTKEHYRYTKDGVRLSCVTCHGSTDARVVAAIAAKSTACLDCHDFSKTIHGGTTTAHAGVGTCVKSGCHTSDVTSVHKGNCNACHAAGTTPSTTCTTCHASGTYHANEATAHVLPVGGCIGDQCHGTSAGGDAALVHKDVCERCHTGDGTPVKTCSTCHGSDTLSLHPGQSAAHTADATSCTSSRCHGTSVTTIHEKAPGGPCGMCHDGSSTPTKVCSDCHDSDIQAVHANAAASHDASSSTCISADCHTNSDVAAIHATETGGPGCVCHTSGDAPTLDCATAGCHPGDLGTVHAAAGEAHTSTNPTCVSANCHVGNVTTLHTNAPLGCKSCHRSGQTLTADCATCHGTDLVTVHASADASHAVPSSMCVTACHANNVAGIHSGTTRGCLACHSTGSTPSTTCSDCHDGTTQEQHASAGVYHTAPAGGCVLSGCHGADVTQLHLATGGLGCARCHAPGQTPTIVCTSCHASDLITVHASADASHAVAAGSNCTGAVCHATNVAAIHNVAGVGCVVCHAEGKTPSTDCSTCHPADIVIVHQKADASHSVATGGSCYTPTCHTSGNVATIHQANPDVSCVACHTPTATTIVCTACHPKTGVPDRHSFAAASHLAPTGTCVQSGCHAADVTLLHLTGPNCAACHGANAPTTLVCTTGGCHSSSLTTVHSAGTVYHAARAGYCVKSGCHGGDLTTIHSANGTGPGCAACHAADVTPSETCTDCHPSTEAAVHASADISHTVSQTTCAGYGGSSPCHHTRVDSFHRTAPDGCRSCHASGTTPSLVCATCHVGANAPTHASAQATAHVAAGGLCVNSQCHSTDVSAIHAGSTKSCLACHGPDATASVTCTDCHTDSVFTLHPTASTHHVVPAGTSCMAPDCHSGTDVASIHDAANGGPGCTACHNTGTTATLDCTAAACHGSDFAVTHAKSDASHAVTSTCVRSGCHTGDAVQLHAAGPGCAACHDNPNHAPSVACSDCHAGDSSSVHDPIIGTKHDPAPGACTAAGCHAISVAGTHSAPAGTYSSNPGPGCAPCHDDGPLTVDCVTCHVGAQAPTHPAAASKHAAPTGTCVKNGCHDSNVTVIHVKNGKQHCEACHNGNTPTLECATCHAGGFTPAHPAPIDKHTADSTISCTQASCHGTNVAVIHTTQVTHTDGTTAPGCIACHADNKTPSLVCGDCHGAGFPANHPAPPAAHTSTDACTGLCHDANVATIHTTATPSHPVPPGCVACHDGVKTPATVCANCHTPGTYHASASSKHAVSNTCTRTGCHSSGDVSVIHVKNGVQMCVDCHAVAVDPAVKGTDCTQCHPGGADHTASHAECNSCHADLYHYNPATIGTGDCLSCHNQGGTWAHPNVGWCHCDDPNGMVWTGLW